ncbi:NlpC/P60 family protein [Sporofaciens sp. SGI.106]|uniref:C40 family peptidase n=1 Tax=Sporofaciens sp. SGI.106 TaxID=3420568 RepID=UPI002A991034|nr:NlpC/P60 family protein [Lachnoclostridium sp.]
MKKRIVQAFVAAVLVSALVVTPVFATPSVDDMKQDKEATQSEVDSLQEQLSSTLNKISELEENMSRKQTEIDKANIDLEESIVKQNEQYEAMKLRIKYMYEEGTGSFLETLLSAKSFSDLVNKAEYIQEVHTYDREKLDEYVETTRKVENLMVSLKEEATELQEMQVSLETEKANLNSTIESKQTEIAQLDQKIQDAIAAQQEAERKAREEREAQLAAAQQAAQQAASNNTGNNANNSNNSGNSGNNGNSGGSSNYVPPQGTDGWAVVAYARQFLGNPYVYGGNSLTDGIDCSGFTQQIYAAFGVSLGRVDSDQAYAGVEVPLSQAQAGDLLCYYGHVGIYNGTGGIIHASSPEVGIVEWADCQYRPLKCVRRVL